MSPAQIWSVTKGTVAEWSEDKVPRLAAALAYYTMLAIAPILIISIKVVGAVFGDEAASGQIQAYLNDTIGNKGAEATEEIIRNASLEGSGVLATVISLCVLLFSASGVFGELQDSLNTIWEVKPNPDRTIWDIVHERFFSVTLVLGTAFLLMVSLVLSTILSNITEAIGGAGWFWEAVHFAFSLGIVATLFALIFKYLPDAKVKWSNVWTGAIITAVLFTIGKFLLGWYLGRGSATSVYGAFGSLVALLIWVYYSAQILLLGAEFTQVNAHRNGKVKPSEHAMNLTEEDRVQQGMPHDKTVRTLAAKERKLRQEEMTADNHS